MILWFLIMTGDFLLSEANKEVSDYFVNKEGIACEHAFSYINNMDAYRALSNQFKRNKLEKLSVFGKKIVS